MVDESGEGQIPTTEASKAPDKLTPAQQFQTTVDTLLDHYKSLESTEETGKKSYPLYAVTPNGTELLILAPPEGERRGINEDVKRRPDGSIEWNLITSRGPDTMGSHIGLPDGSNEWNSITSRGPGMTGSHTGFPDGSNEWDSITSRGPDTTEGYIGFAKGFAKDSIVKSGDSVTSTSTDITDLPGAKTEIHTHQLSKPEDRKTVESQLNRAVSSLKPFLPQASE